MAENAAGMATNLVRPAAEEIGKNIVMVVKRQFNYLCCFNTNIQRMREEAKKLEDAKARLQMQVDDAEINTRVIVPEVMTWINTANEIQVQMKGIDTDVPNVRSGSLNVIPHYSLSKKAKEMVEAMEELRKTSTFDTISLPALPASRLNFPLGQMYELQSRKQIEEAIIEALRGKIVSLLGIYGIGGTGKTTMAKKIMQRMREENLFDEVVFVVVSQCINVLNIQGEMAELLGIKEFKDVVSQQARALKLHERLSGTKRIFIILDDLWEKINLEDLGIPTSCTTLLTTRNKELLDYMKAQVFEMKILPEADAWSLFREKVGTCVDDLTLVSIAKEVVKECNGLPLVIVNVGSALRNKQKQSWNDAVRRLKSPNPRNVPEFLKKVYNPLHLSYDSLKDPEAESMFLLCSLFPEDFDINLETLTLYIMGLNILEGVDSMEEARNTVFTVVDKLKSHSLLLNGTKKNKVKMHDVIRDVAIFITSEQGFIEPQARSHSCRDSKWISMFSKASNEFLDQLIGSDFPNLQLLFIHHEEAFEWLEIKDLSFLEAMKKLNVLSFKGISFQSLSPSVKLLKNLQTLRLVKCSLKTISGVGELSSLKILSFHHCQNIEELPVEVGRLKRLRLLEFTDCFNLRHIAPGIIKELVELEELKMLGSFGGWESTFKVNKKVRRNTSLKELESLTKLTCLEIQIVDCSLISEEIFLPSSIAKHNIQIGSKAFGLIDLGNENYLVMDGYGSRTPIKFGSWPQHLVMTTTVFRCDGSIDFRNLNLLKAQNIKTLSICENRVLEKLVDTSTISFNQRGSNFFPALESLMLNGLPHFKEICNGLIPEDSIFFENLGQLSLCDMPSLMHLWTCPYQNISFSNLYEIRIDGCGMLRNLFSFKLAKYVFRKLKSINIRDCKMMEEVYAVEENDNDRGKTSDFAFPKLEELMVWSLSSLTALGKGVESMEFPILKKFVIRDCSKLKSMESGQNWLNHDHQSLHLFCNQKVKFGGVEDLEIHGYDVISNIWCQQISLDFFRNLKHLNIYNCNNIGYLFSSSMTENLLNLQRLLVCGCQRMEQVITDKKEIHECYILFPRLEKLSLGGLPKLNFLCESKCALELPLLEDISIVDCQVMTSFTCGSLTTPNLKEIEVNNKYYTVEELNQRGGLNGLLCRN